jgi:hypothetical protein
MNTRPEIRGRERNELSIRRPSIASTCFSTDALIGTCQGSPDRDKETLADLTLLAFESGHVRNLAT